MDCGFTAFEIEGPELQRLAEGTQIGIRSSLGLAALWLQREDVVYGRQEIARIDLNDVALCAGSQSFLDNLRRGILAHKEYFGARGQASKPSSRLDSIERRQSDVKQDQVRMQCLSVLDSFPAI